MNKLLYISLAISILGILLFFIISNFQNPNQISDYSDLKLNDYAQTTGKIISIRSYDDFSIIKLDNNISVTCNCKLKINQTIQVAGKVTEFNNLLQIQAEKIKLI